MALHLLVGGADEHLVDGDAARARDDGGDRVGDVRGGRRGKAGGAPSTDGGRPGRWSDVESMDVTSKERVAPAFHQPLVG